MQFRTIFVFASLACLAAIGAQQAGEELVVAVKPKATLRSEGNLTGKVIGGIEFGKVVKVIAVDQYSDQVMNVGGKWLQVEYAGKTGWVFGALLKRKDEQHTVRILNGTIIADDPAANVPGDLKQLLDAVGGAEISIDIQDIPDSGRFCNGKLIFAVRGKVRNTGNTFACGGTTFESRYALSEWQVISGRLYFTAMRKWSDVCHSERCTDKSHSEKTTRELKNIKKVSATAFSAEFSG